MQRRLSAILLILSCLPAAAQTVTDSPSGAGDPDAMVCRAPQHIAGSDQLGPKVCLFNREWWKVAMNGKDVAADGKTLIDRPTVDRPTGKGDPDAVTCRKPQIVYNSKTDVRYGPEVCQTNRFWANLLNNGQIVDARGGIVAPGFDIDFPSPTNARYDSGHVQSGQPLYGNPSQLPTTP